MRKWKQRLFSLLLCAAMLFSLCMPASAAEGDVSFFYCDESGKNWKTGTCSTYKAVTEDTDEWEDSWYVAEGAVNIGRRVGVSGNVHLILKDSCELETEYGITLYEGASLTIYAQSDGEKMGKLTARYSGSTDAGIKVNSGSTITINGGEVTAYGSGGAGIGSVYRSEGGEITINGGKVTASSFSGAGIGGGYSGAGHVIINGGTVKATSNSDGAGIGGGYGGNGGTIKITGGEVTATSEGRGAGIGGGCSYASSGNGGTITISGGTVTATGSDGAGIGGGVGGNGGTIAISGNADVTATGGIGAGIGGGNGGAGGKITISGGTVMANSANGAGIGGGKDGESGTFAADGNAFIVASSISDNGDTTDWSGVIFQGTDDGKIYKSPIALDTDATIPAGKTLVIEEGETLIIGKGVTLTNNGAITGGGIIVNNGTITGKPIDPGVAEHTGKTEWSSDSGSHWHLCARRSYIRQRRPQLR